MTVLNEDTIYRASSQFRLWSFTPETLSSLRQTANSTACDHVHKRRKLSHTTDSPNRHVEPLNVSDELHALQHIHLPLLIRIAETYFAHLPALSRVISTASQYLRRYYLTTSLMAPAPSQGPLPDTSAPAVTPTPTSTLPTASTMTILASLYLAMKVHDLPYDLSSFVDRVRDKGAREKLHGATALSIEGMKRTEQALTRMLRFCFDVRHAGDGVKGLELDLHALLRDDGGKGPHKARRAQLRTELLRLCNAKDEAGTATATAITNGEEHINADTVALKAAQTRIQKALISATSLLLQPIHATDAYFLYTPSQILFAALMITDHELAEWYLGSKFPVPTANGAAYADGGAGVGTGAGTVSEAGAGDGTNGDSNGHSDGDGNGTKAGEQNAETKNESDHIFTLRDRVSSTIHSCAELLRSSLAAQTAVQADPGAVRTLEARLSAIQTLLSSPLPISASTADVHAHADTNTTTNTTNTTTNGNGNGNANAAANLSVPDLTSEDNSEASRGTSVKRGSTRAGFSSSEEEEDEVVGKGRRKKRRVEDDDVFGPML